MTAGACAMFVIVGGGVAGAVSTMTAPGPAGVTAQAIDTDLGAPRLEEDPEVVSRAAAAAEPLPRRHDEPPVPPSPPPAAEKAQGAAAPRIAAATDHLRRARVADERADRTGPRSARTLAQTPARRKAAAAPVVTTRTDVETKAVPFDTQVIRDPSMFRGVRRVETPGSPGERTMRYLVTLTDGKQTSRRLLSSAVTEQPQNRVIAVGSARRVEPDMDCDQILGVCLPFGRSAAVCPAGGPADRHAPEPAVDGGSGDILIDTEDLELLGPDGIAGLEALETARLEPAELC
jgi:hypothetical protein